MKRIFPGWGNLGQVKVYVKPFFWLGMLVSPLSTLIGSYCIVLNLHSFWAYELVSCFSGVRADPGFETAADTVCATALSVNECFAKTLHKHAVQCQYLRHWLQYWQLRTWIHDNLCYQTIRSGTGQHSEFLRCLVWVLFKSANVDWPLSYISVQIKEPRSRQTRLRRGWQNQIFTGKRVSRR